MVWSSWNFVQVAQAAEVHSTGYCTATWKALLCYIRHTRRLCQIQIPSEREREFESLRCRRFLCFCNHHFGDWWQGNQNMSKFATRSWKVTCSFNEQAQNHLVICRDHATMKIMEYLNFLLSYYIIWTHWKYIVGGSSYGCWFLLKRD